MRLKSTAEMDCSIARTLDVVGEWWTLLIVRDLLQGTHRFDRLQAGLGIARNVLTARLERLVENGIVATSLYQERPPRYEYHLTPKGRELSIVLYSLMEWGDRWTREPGDAPPLRIEHASCGHALQTALTCPDCRAIVPEEERHAIASARAPSTK